MESERVILKRNAMTYFTRVTHISHICSTIELIPHALLILASNILLSMPCLLGAWCSLEHGR